MLNTNLNTQGNLYKNLSRYDGVDPTKINAVAEAVVNKYRDPKRSYHDLTHIAYMLQSFETYKHEASSEKYFGEPYLPENLIETAIWFHDVIYDLDNYDDSRSVSRSAEYCASALEYIGVIKPEIRYVVNLVMATDHSSRSVNSTSYVDRIIRDLDFSGFAAYQFKFDWHTEALYREYLWTVDRTWLDGKKSSRPRDTKKRRRQFDLLRLSFLNGLLCKPSIFSTEIGRSLWEESAKKNIQRELDRIRKVV